MQSSFMASSPRVSVAPADDPYKKYWWGILAGFVLVGGWLCLPVMEAPVGSAHVDTSKPAVDPNAEQSLDSVDGSIGAAGSAIDLSMDGAGKRKSKSDEAIASMLYQAPPDAGAAAAGAPLGAASSSISLAQQLKTVGSKKSDDTGGWGEKAQKGFTAPHLGGGGGLSGLGGGGGGSSASASASSGMGAFGSRASQIGFGSTKGLKDDGSADKAETGMQALKSAAQTSAAAAASKSNDAARGGSGSFFDGSKGATSDVGLPAGGPNDAGAYAALDAAPTNLKVNDPTLDKKELKPPPATDVPQAADNSQMMKQLAMMAATALIGGMIPGAGGQMVMMMGMMMMQQQQAKEAEAKSAAQQKAAEQRMGM
jgi:hypothetical protein